MPGRSVDCSQCLVAFSFGEQRHWAGNSFKVTPGVIQAKGWADREEKDATREEKARNNGEEPRTSVGKTRRRKQADSPWLHFWCV